MILVEPVSHQEVVWAKLPVPNFLEQKSHFLFSTTSFYERAEGRYMLFVLLFLSLLFNHQPKYVTKTKGRYDYK
jgi:hypothetical protein